MKPPYSTIDELRTGSVDEFIQYLRAERKTAGCTVEAIEILYLMSALDAFMLLEAWDHDNPMKGDNWEPKSQQVIEMLQRLIAAENRKALNAWYRQFPPGREINSAAEMLRRYLSTRIGENLGKAP